jgi:FAD-linked sulfhydryl oxidase
MDPNVWGPHGWYFLHSITLAYPDNPSDDVKMIHNNFFNSLKDILPCDKCKIHYAQNLLTYPVENHLENKESLFKWLVDIHNRINIDSGKREYSYDEVTELYENMYNKSNKNLLTNKVLFALFGLLLLCLVFFYLRK